MIQPSSLLRIPALAAALLLLLCAEAAMAAPSIEQIQYWRTTYQELTPADDPHAAEAHAILARLVQVAGKRLGVEPRLFITARNPWDITLLSIAIPDGWIILSKGVLDICYREPTWGQDRLAFILAHELAHHLRDDLWHMHFFEASKTRTPELQALLDELHRSMGATEHVLAREVQADRQGILYAAVAGFAPQAIVSADQRVNFFADWARALDPPRSQGIDAKPVRPTPEERAEALRTTLREIADRTTAFQAGLWFYYAGDYPRAIQAFNTFRTEFAGREVHQNLAASHHQLALQAYRAWQPEAQTFPFRLPVAIDPLTRASQVYLERTRGQSTAPAEQFRQHLEQAIHWYGTALDQEPTYTLAARNLGAALLLRGVQTPKAGPHPDFAKAVSLLLQALEQAPQDPALLTTLGVALWYDERPDRAKEILRQAHTLAPAAAAPVCNLGVIARLEHRDADAQHDQADCTRLTDGPAAPPLTFHPSAETVAGVRPGDPEQDVPMSWGVPTRSTVQLADQPYTVATYPTGIMTLAQGGELLMLLVREGFGGASVQGIRLGSSVSDVRAHYGPPTRRHELPQGQSWAYDTHRMAFQFRAGQVVSWLRF